MTASRVATYVDVIGYRIALIGLHDLACLEYDAVSRRGGASPVAQIGRAS